MGITSLFSPRADLSGLLDPPVPPQLHVADIIHKATIEINERYTVAAAVTSKFLLLN